MPNHLRDLASLYRAFGARWLLFRLGYALRMRTGLIRLETPSYDWSDRPLASWLKEGIPAEARAYAEWRRHNAPSLFFEQAVLPDNVPWNRQQAVEDARRILRGEIRYFSHSLVKTGFPPDWHTDPVSGVRLDAGRHWSQISNDREVDIKFIWEVNRFGFAYTLARAYASTRDEEFAEAFWRLVQAWAESNPPNTGPNWMDGQEIALRLMAWLFACRQFSESSSSTPERMAQLTVLVAAQAERIHRNIGFALSTRSNHIISEAFGLWLVGLFFPELKASTRYLRLGRQLLEREAAAQILPDGGYSMYSLNYHRFVLQIYLCTLRLSELNHSPVSGTIRRAIADSIDFLAQLIDPETGQMPVYGSNDGALVLPLNTCPYTDYRPLLQLGSFLTRGERLFPTGPWDEDLYWFLGSQALHTSVKPPQQGPRGFPHAGLYILHGAGSKAVVRCTDYRARPSHADQLHVDLWWRGHNIACDAGTYLYSGQGPWRNGLARTSVHNTVMVDRQDQMRMVSRFIWIDWARGKVLRQDPEIWQGEHDGYHRLPDPVTHRRTVRIVGQDRWLVVDHLTAQKTHHYALHWLLNDFPYERQGSALILSLDGVRFQVQVGVVGGSGDLSLVRADSDSTRGWRSRYYGQKEPALSVMLETDQSRASFWSFFGFEGDLVRLEGDSLIVNADKIPLFE